MTNRELNQALTQANDLIATLQKEKEALVEELSKTQALLDDVTIREAKANIRLLEATSLLLEGVELLAETSNKLTRIPKPIRWIFGAQ